MTLIQRSRSKEEEKRRRDAEDQRRRAIELRIISAQDLKKARLQLGRMRTYAVAYVEEQQKARTSVDEQGGQNPVWNDVLTISVPERLLGKDSLACLNVDIFSCGGKLIFRRDKLVGSVRIFLSDVLKEGAAHMNPIHCLAFWIRLPSGEPHGILNVWIPPSGKFLRRQHDSEDFSRMLSFPRHPPAADLHVRYRYLSPPARSLSVPAHDLAQHIDCDTETFTFPL